MQITLDDILNRKNPPACFVRAYLECALWSTINEDSEYGESFDAEHDIKDFSPAAIKQAISECTGFMTVYRGLLEHAETFAYTLDQAGHDLWLTRNGHGAGFWDRGLGTTGEQLTSACGHGTSLPGLSIYKSKEGLAFEHA